MITEKRLNELERDWEDTLMPWVNRAHGEFCSVPAEIDMVIDILFPEIRRQRSQIKQLKKLVERLKEVINTHKEVE